MDASRHLLPVEASEGVQLRVEIEDSSVIRAVIDDEATLAAHQRIQEKLACLHRGKHLDRDDDAR